MRVVFFDASLTPLAQNTIAFKVKNSRTQQTTVWSMATMEDRLAAMQQLFVAWYVLSYLSLSGLFV
jgi:hypothetical protein